MNVNYSVICQCIANCKYLLIRFYKAIIASTDRNFLLLTSLLVGINKEIQIAKVESYSSHQFVYLQLHRLLSNMLFLFPSNCYI